MNEVRLRHGEGVEVTYVTNSNKVKHSLEGSYHKVWNSINEGNHYNKVIAQDLNLNESTTLRIINTMIKHKLIEKKTSHEIKLEEAHESIKELIKNKDLRIIFYFQLARETKRYDPGYQNKKVVKKLKQIEDQISDLKNDHKENPHSMTMFLFAISLMISSLLVIFGYSVMNVNIIGQFVFGLGLILMFLLGIGLITSIKKYRELSLNSN